MALAIRLAAQSRLLSKRHLCTLVQIKYKCFVDGLYTYVGCETFSTNLLSLRCAAGPMALNGTDRPFNLSAKIQGTYGLILYLWPYTVPIQGIPMAFTNANYANRLSS